MGIEVRVFNAEIPVKQIEQLLFHEVYFLNREQTHGVSCPVLVLR